MSDLQELFARLKSSDTPTHAANGAPSIWAQPQGEGYQQPTAPLPLWSPPILAPSQNPFASPSATPMDQPAAPEQARTNNLLNLLKFNNQSGGQASPLASLQNVSGSSQSRTLSSQDLMASLQRKPSASGALPSALTGIGAEKPRSVTTPSNQQDFLLNLLRKPNAPKVPQLQPDTVLPSIETPVPKHEISVDALADSFAEASVRRVSSNTASGGEREPTPARMFGTTESRETTPFEAPQPVKPNPFSYSNPFEELHASSPLNRTPKPEVQQAKAAQAAQAQPKKIEILKHGRDFSSFGNGDTGAPAAKNRKIEESAPVEVENKKESVSAALEAAGEKVEKQVEKALAKAVSNDKATEAPTPTKGADPPAPTIKAEQTIDNDDVESSWESAEDSANGKETKVAFKVKVYNFPMKPFVTIIIKHPQDAAQPIRQENFLVIALLKKEFDQIDRCLVTASQTHIVYAQTANKKDNAGFRVIRQDTGDHKQIFRTSAERVFSVQLCNSTVPGDDVEGVLATGVNGSVFWTSLAKSRGEYFPEDDIEALGFIMPAVATAEESTSGSPVKTRAKCSSRHPDVFAISRGKMIHLVAPETAKERAYCKQNTRKVDTAKYLAEHGLRINTGKAGKDFVFSEDDSMIVSLDKSAVVKFWDIRDLVKRAQDSNEGAHAPVELKDPIWTLTAAASGSTQQEKPSVSSIMLLDKERPHTKGIALRYMLVGFKQNHILQLWDLGLGRAVQELRLPHEKDSDGICSLAYHPKTGIIVVGHPTRNSIYFIHLSAPKYNVAFMEQARYVAMLAHDDKSLPKPESTAIMSGLREFSLANVGQLRSLDMLRTPVANENAGGPEEETVFELYVSHDKGLVGISVKRADLGWDAASKMISPMDAVKEGVVEVIELKTPAIGAKEAAPAAEPTAAPEPVSKKAEKKDAKKEEVAKAAPKPEILKRQAPAPAPASTSTPVAATNGQQRAHEGVKEKPSMQIPEAPTPSQITSVNPPIITPDSYVLASQGSKSPPRESATKEAAKAAKNTGAARKLTQAATAPAPSPPTAAAPAPTATPTPNTSAALAKQFDALYSRLDADKRVNEASGAARQDAMLRLVSSTLTENVEQSLSRIIGASIANEVIPTLTTATTTILDKRITESLPQQLGVSLQREIKATLPQALKEAMKDPHVQKVISDITAKQVAQGVQQQVSTLLQQSLPNMATQATSKMVADLEARTTERLQTAEAQRVQDNTKIEQLTGLVTSLSATIQGMAESQAAFQEQIIKMQQARKSESSGSEGRAESATQSATASSAAPVDPQKLAEEREVNEITELLKHGDYESATIQVSHEARFC